MALDHLKPCGHLHNQRRTRGTFHPTVPTTVQSPFTYTSLPISSCTCSWLNTRAATTDSRPQYTRSVAIAASPGSRTAVAASPGTAKAYAIRRATAADAQQVAFVCAESFGKGNYPGLESPTLDELEAKYAAAILREVDQKVVKALAQKQQARREHREFRLRRLVLQMRAEMAAKEGRAATFPSLITPADQRKITKWQRERKFQILVIDEPSGSASIMTHGSQAQPTASPASTSKPQDASHDSTCTETAEPVVSDQSSQTQSAAQNGASEEDISHTAPGAAEGDAFSERPTPNSIPGSTASSSSQVQGHRRHLVACVTLSLMQCEARLPPPFPSTKPYRAYISNMAVLPGHRRQGIAHRLVQACEQLAARWGHGTIWLNVRALNTSAIKLYTARGFQVVDQGNMLIGPLRELLMVKHITPVVRRCAPAQRSTPNTATATSSDLFLATKPTPVSVTASSTANASLEPVQSMPAAVTASSSSLVAPLTSSSMSGETSAPSGQAVVASSEPMQTASSSSGSSTLPARTNRDSSAATPAASELGTAPQRPLEQPPDAGTRQLGDQNLSNSANGGGSMGAANDAAGEGGMSSGRAFNWAQASRDF